MAERTMNRNVNTNDSVEGDFVFAFEKFFILPFTEHQLQTHFQASVAASVTYLLTIHLLQCWMANRKPMDLRWPLAIWNIILATSSFIIVWRIFPKFFRALKTHGLVHTVCDNRLVVVEDVNGFWILIFGYSKFAELSDTVFIILRKRKLIFLHWYHHTTVLMYSWFSYSHKVAAIQWFSLMNCFVHAIMYGYFAIRAMRINVPLSIAMAITSLQILQMIGGMAIIALAYINYSSGETCQITPLSAYFGWAMYFSYLVLFLKVFYESYVKKDAKHYPERVKQN